MRMGAIFARGSCRALKWMALFGVVFALGAGQAAAQTVERVTYDKSDVTVTMSSEVRVSSGILADLAATAFTIAGNSARSHKVSIKMEGSVDFEVAFTTELTGAATQMTYTPPTGPRIVNATTGVEVSTFTVTVLPATPLLPLVPNQLVQMGQPANIVLPKAVGGTGTLTYTLSDLPTGLTFTGATRTIAGTTTDPVGTRQQLTYKASDDKSQSETQFYIEVTAAAATVNTTGVITGISVDGSVEKSVGGTKRQHVTEGVLTKATVKIRWSHAQLRQFWQGVATGSKPPDVPVTLQMTPLASAESWLSEAENEAGHDDVTIGTAAMVVVPKKPSSATSVGYEEGTGSTSIHFGLDPDAEAEAFELIVPSASAANLAAGSMTRSKVHVIEDIHPQNIVVKRDGSGVIYEGRSGVKFDVTADPPREDLVLDVRFDLEDVTGQTVASRDNYIDKAVGTIPTGPGSAAKDTVTLTLDDNDGNRDDDKLALHAEVVVYALDTGAYDGIDDPDPVEITVIDVHKIPPFAVAPKTVTVTEGKNTTLTYTIDRNPPDTIVLNPETREYTSEALTLTVMAMDASMTDDFRIVAPKVTIEKHDGKSPWEQSADVEVEIKLDDDLGVETLVLEATLEGTVAANGPGMRPDPTDIRLKEATTAAITIEDATVKLVEAKTQAELDAAIKEAGADAELTVDDMVTIMGSALFDSVDGATVIYSAMSSAASVASVLVSGGEIMVTAKGKGDAMITVEASATMGSVGVTANPQTEPDRASVDIPISVALVPLSIMLEGPDAGMNLVEGMEYTITAKANRAVEMDTMIELFQTAGTASPADYTVENITISAGESMGTTKLMVVEDNMNENEGNMQESLTIEGRVGTMKTTNSLMFHLWDAAVPALPVLAQLLLAAFLALGGYRRYLRR